MSTGGLPKGWLVVRFGDVLTINPRDDLSSLTDDILVSFVPMQAVEELSGRIDSSRKRRFAEVKRGYTQFRDRDLLLAKITPCMENGKFAIADGLANGRGFGSTEFHVLRCPQEISNRYVFYYAIRDKFRNDAAHNMKGTAGQKRVPPDWLAKAEIPIAPLAEQRRIVAAIDALFTRLNSAEAGLAKTRALRGQFLRSAKNALVTGRLAPASETVNDKTPASRLLLEILRKRSQSWCERQVANRGERRTPKNLAAAARKYVDPIGPHKSQIPRCAIPSNWAWVSLDQLLVSIEAGKNLRCVERPPMATETGIVKVSAVSWGRFLEDESKTLPKGAGFDPYYRIRKGDFLFSRANTIELVGACVIVDEISSDLLLSDKILRFVFAADIARWVLTVLRSPIGRQQIESLSTGNQESMRNISQTNIRRIVIPLPPKELLPRLSEMGEALIVTSNSTEEAVDTQLGAVTQMRQSILSAAFRGELVPQDPSDEPAEALLKRVRARKSAEGGISKRVCRKLKEAAL